MTLAAGVAACGSTATASSKTTTTAVKPATSGPAAAPTVDCGAPNQPPKNMPPQPVADNCWAGGFYLGTGSFHNRKIIYADKFANYTVDQITPQLIRTNPALAQTILKSAEQAMTPGIAKLAWAGLSSMAAKGESLVLTGKNPSDPTGMRFNYPTIVSGGVSVFSKGVSNAQDPTTATVRECADGEGYIVGSNNQPVPGVEGKAGFMQWTDTLIKTSIGWQVEQAGLPKAVTSC